MQSMTALATSAPSATSIVSASSSSYPTRVVGIKRSSTDSGYATSIGGIHEVEERARKASRSDSMASMYHSSEAQSPSIYARSSTGRSSPTNYDHHQSSHQCITLPPLSQAVPSRCSSKEGSHSPRRRSSTTKIPIAALISERSSSISTSPQTHLRRSPEAYSWGPHDDAASAQPYYSYHHHHHHHHRSFPPPHAPPAQHTHFHQQSAFPPPHQLAPLTPGLPPSAVPSTATASPTSAVSPGSMSGSRPQGPSRESSRNEIPSIRDLACPHCSLVFLGDMELRDHLRHQCQEKHYACSTCHARFRRLNDLDRHSRIHTGERPHLCDICGRRFSRATTLKRHRQGIEGCAGRRADLGMRHSNMPRDKLSRSIPSSPASNVLPVLSPRQQQHGPIPHHAHDPAGSSMPPSLEQSFRRSSVPH